MPRKESLYASKCNEDLGAGAGNLKRWMKLRGVRVKDLAQFLGVSEASASRLVRGQQNITLDDAARVQQITGGLVTPNDLLEDRRHSEVS